MLKRVVLDLSAGILLVSGLFSQPTRAQDAAGVANLFGGLLGAAIAEQGRAEWRAIGKEEQLCVNRGLQQQGGSLQQVIAAGITPSDGRLASIRSTCGSISARKFKQNVVCTINTPTGVFGSRCDEDYASLSAGEPVRLSRAEAIDAAFSDRQVSTRLFERPDAMARRQQMMAGGINSGTVATPNFDCSRVTSPTATAICRSNALAALDAEYGALYQRVLDAVDHQQAIIKQARKFLDERNACESAEECIRQNLVNSLEYMARVARKHGEEVVTSVEQARKAAAAEAARGAAEQRMLALAERQNADRQENERRQAAAAAQQEAEQKAEAARKAAEAVRHEAERRAKLRTTAEATKGMIDQASDFLKFDPQNQRMLTIAEAIAAANAALETDDLGRLEKAADELQHAFRDDAGFPKYLSTRAEEKSRENARLLADALLLAQQQRRFLASYIAQNPTSPASAKEIGQLRRLDALLATPDLRRLQEASTGIGDDLRRFDLQDNFLLSLNAVDDKAHAGTGAVPVADLGTSTTDKNRFLLDGAAGDLVVMYVAAPSAPHVVKNLRGDIVFDQHAATACLYQKEGSNALRDRVQVALQKFALKQLLIDAHACAQADLLSVDLVAVERGSFLRQGPAYAATLLKEIEADHVKPLVAVTETQAEASLQSADDKRRRLQQDIEHGTLDGFALLVFPAMQDGPICGSLESGELDAHEAILARFEDPTVARLRQHLKLDVGSVEDLFAAVQRSRCAAVYARGEDAKALLEAVQREKITYQLFPTPVSTGQVKAERERIAAERASEDKDALVRQRHADETRALQAQREADQAGTKAAQQSALRAEYGKVATAYAAQIADEVKAYVNAGGTPRGDEPGANVPGLFPNLSAWFVDRLKDHWELQSVDSELEDYGTADWKGRKVESAFTTVRQRMKNKAFGEYQDACYALGELIDHEFSVTRDHVDVACGDLAALRSWKQAHNLASRWIVE